MKITDKRGEQQGSVNDQATPKSEEVSASAEGDGSGITETPAPAVDPLVGLVRKPEIGEEIYWGDVKFKLVGFTAQGAIIVPVGISPQGLKRLRRATRNAKA